MKEAVSSWKGTRMEKQADEGREGSWLWEREEQGET